MSLAAKGSKSKLLEDALVKEDRLAPVVGMRAPTAADEVAAAPAAAAVQHPVMLLATEKISATLTRDGDISTVELKGSLTLTATDDNVSICTIDLGSAGRGDTFTFNIHPKINKALYEQRGLLQLKDTSKGFPSGRPVAILRWSNSAASMDFVPITINCWPEEEGRNQMIVSIEYTASTKMSLHDVRIHIPIASAEAPNVRNVDGRYKFNKQAGELVWEIDLVDKSNSNGSLEFSIAEKDPDSFFPINVDFSSQQLYCAISVRSVKFTEGEAPIMFGFSQGMAAEGYTIA